MIERAATGVTGCCGATSSVWDGADRASDVSSHPDLSQLMLQQPDQRLSPMFTAAQTVKPTAVRDTLNDRRWEAFSLAALRIGVRSLACGVVGLGGRAITCTLYSLVPDGLPAGSAAIATALIRESLWTTAQVNDYERARCEVHHLTEAIATREVIEQAKGMIMQGLQCDATTAFEHLAQASRGGQLRMAEAARRLVDIHPQGVALRKAQVARPGGDRSKS